MLKGLKVSIIYFVINLAIGATSIKLHPKRFTEEEILTVSFVVFFISLSAWTVAHYLEK